MTECGRVRPSALAVALLLLYCCTLTHPPVKEKNGRGTGIGTLMPTWPTSISYWNLRAAAPEEVKMAQPLPYMEALVKAMASLSVDTFTHSNTGPKISGAGWGRMMWCYWVGWGGVRSSVWQAEMEDEVGLKWD